MELQSISEQDYFITLPPKSLQSVFKPNIIYQTSYASSNREGETKPKETVFSVSVKVVRDWKLLISE